MAQSSTITRGSSCLLTLRFVSQMYSCPFRRCQFSSLFSLHWWTNNHGSCEYRQGVFCYAKHAWKRSMVEPQGPVGYLRFPRKSIHISASNGRWRYRWGRLDNKFVENSETRRHGGMYSIASFETSILTLLRKKPFMPMVYKIFQMNYN